MRLQFLARRALATRPRPAVALSSLYSVDQPHPKVTSASAQLAASQPCEDYHGVVSLCDGSTLFVMLDGHAGTHAVDFAATTLVNQARARLEEIVTTDKLQRDADYDPASPQVPLVRAALIDAFEQTDELFKEQVRSLGKPRKVMITGACAMLVHLSADQTEIHIANAGDCRVVLAQIAEEGAPVVPLALSQDHFALTNKSEKTRLETEHPDEARLLVRGYVKGRVQMTRSLGDLYLKDAEFNTSELGKTRVVEPYTPPYLTCTPEVTVHRVTSQDRFLVIASDGLWSEMSNKEVVTMAEEAKERGDCPARELAASALQTAAIAEGLPVEAVLRIPTGRVRKRIHDDISVTVVDLQLLNAEPRLEVRVQAIESVLGKVVLCAHEDEVRVPVEWLPEDVKVGDMIELVKPK